jgi:hypothetical protein
MISRLQTNKLIRYFARRNSSQGCFFQSAYLEVNADCPEFCKAWFAFTVGIELEDDLCRRKNAKNVDTQVQIPSSDGFAVQLTVGRI